MPRMGARFFPDIPPDFPSSLVRFIIPETLSPSVIIPEQSSGVIANQQELCPLSGAVESGPAGMQRGFVVVPSL